MNKLEKEIFEMEEELGVPSHLRWHNSKPKQETLEEVSERFSNQFLNNGDNSEFEAQAALLGVNFGAKWQQERMYSEEEVVNILIKAYIDIQKRKISNQAVLASWFEQFKKK